MKEIKYINFVLLVLAVLLYILFLLDIRSFGGNITILCLLVMIAFYTRRQVQIKIGLMEKECQMIEDPVAKKEYLEKIRSKRIFSNVYPVIIIAYGIVNFIAML